MAGHFFRPRARGKHPSPPRHDPDAIPRALLAHENAADVTNPRPRRGQRPGSSRAVRCFKEMFCLGQFGQKTIGK